MKRTRLVSAVLACALLGGPAAAADWPDLSRPARPVGGGDHDAAVVVGVEGYAFVPPVPGAETNAKAWYDYLTKTRNAPPGRVKLLLGNDAAREDMIGAARKAAAKVGPDGTLWYIFIGHGAPSIDGKDGLLVGVDAQQKAESLQTHSLKRGELLKALAASRARKIVVVLDACFSGRGPDGASIAPGLQPLVTVAPLGAVDPRMVVLTAAKGDQFAGGLPGAQRPAFSYLVLGGLRGWAGQARVTAGDLLRYASDALDATLTGRNQTPDLIGREGTLIGPTAGESGPDLAELAKSAAGGGSASGRYHPTKYPAAPQAQASRSAESNAESFAGESGMKPIPNGGFIKTLTEGDGERPTSASTVKVNYRGTFLDGKEFDSSYARNAPATFPLRGVIPCWTNGVAMMRVGGKARLVCPSSVAYGDRGMPPIIPGGATLVFDIELLDIVR